MPSTSKTNREANSKANSRSKPISVTQKRINEIVPKMLDAIEHIVGKISPPEPAPNRPSIVEVRRHGADMIQTWRYCDKTACRRARFCRGDAVYCLRATVPKLPPDILAEFVKRRRRPRRNRGRGLLGTGS